MAAALQVFTKQCPLKRSWGLCHVLCCSHLNRKRWLLPGCKGHTRCSCRICTVCGSINRSDLEVTGAAKDDVSRAVASRGGCKRSERATAENMNSDMSRKVQIHKLMGNRYTTHMELMLLSFIHKHVIPIQC